MDIHLFQYQIISCKCSAVITKRRIKATLKTVANQTKVPTQHLPIRISTNVVKIIKKVKQVALCHSWSDNNSILSFLLQFYTYEYIIHMLFAAAFTWMLVAGNNNWRFLWQHASDNISGYTNKDMCRLNKSSQYPNIIIYEIKVPQCICRFRIFFWYIYNILYIHI